MRLAEVGVKFLVPAGLALPPARAVVGQQPTG
jgi:hypothetical protein